MTETTPKGTTTRPQAAPGGDPAGGGCTTGGAVPAEVTPTCAAPEAATAASAGCACARAGLIVSPVPPEPDVPTVAIVTVSWPPLGSTSTSIASPATNPLTLVTLMFVSPGFAAAASVVSPVTSPVSDGAPQLCPPSVDPMSWSRLEAALST